ncbi:hypothetical protein RAC89_06355 [Paenibacillus sp. GD4]|jgi:hypothetical protein|uniref:hypothetical protein n=1 Tax=Paenibacillus sp. GD4 TaxID=3068890 RepID=UPI00279647FF|nr:hypothetical protein [Paenibacillus sp. GD4]MDQ1910119.1 hypothetical protein [Paenibacillus sp. GD4]
MDKKNKACAKIRFDSREEATHFANGMKITITNDLEAYLCSICSGWHIRISGKGNKDSIDTALCS